MEYEFKPYDILQSHNGPNGRWLDFMTLRTEAEARQALQMVCHGEFNGRFIGFRIMRNGTVVAD